MAREVLCISDLGTGFCWDAGTSKINTSGGNFSITDGVTTQVIDDGNTILFTDGNGATVTVSATDTVNIAARLSTDAGNEISFGTDGGLFVNNNLLTGASWNDATNNLVLTFETGTVNVPIIDVVSAFLADFTVSGNTGTDLVNNHETLNIVGAANSGLTTTVTANTVTIDFNCAEPLDVTGFPVC